MGIGGSRGLKESRIMVAVVQNVCMPGDMARYWVDYGDNICTSSPSLQFLIQLGVAIEESPTYDRNCADIFQMNIGSLYTSELDHELD